jgi:hypothetical protein
MGIGAFIGLLIICLEVGIYNKLLGLPQADETGSKIAHFFASVWPGTFLAISIGITVTLTVCWWFKI